MQLAETNGPFRRGDIGNARRSRVLYVVNSMSVGGIQTYLLNVLRHYDRTRFEMDVCYTGAQPGCFAHDVKALGSRMIRCRYTNSFLPFVLRLAGILRDGQYSVVCDFSGDFAAGSMWAGRLVGVPTRMALYRSSGTKYRPTLSRRVVARLLHRSVLWHATSVVSNSHANIASAFQPREIDGRFAVVYNGVDVSRFVLPRGETRQAVRNEFGFRKGECVIGHVGSFIPPKAHDVLLEAFAKLASAHMTARLFLVGDGIMRVDLEQEVRRRGLSDRVTFTGLRHDVPRLLQGMDVFVLPSRFEGFPNALIEAQAVGLPVVATDRPEIREAVPQENHDCLAPVEDAAALASKIATMVNDSKFAAQKGAVGAAFVRRELTIARSIEEFCRHLAPATDEEKSKPGGVQPSILLEDRPHHK